MWALAHAALRAVREGDAVGRPVGRALLVAVTALALMHSVDEYFLNVGVPHLLWALAALAMHPPARDRAGGP
jgi:hypothetical protein